MGRLQHHHRSRSASSFARSSETTAADPDTGSIGSAPAETVECPFGTIDGLGHVELLEAAYEVFFMSCRADGGRGGGGMSYFPAGGEGGGDGSPTIGAGPRGGTGMNVVSSRVKRALGLRARRSSQPTTVRSSSLNPSSAPGSPGRMRAMRDQQAAPGSPGKPRRPMTSAEIMRQQMRVTEQGDARLRKTLMRTLVGQVGRKADTIILPLELLRQLKLTDFADSGEHHQWQRRQFRLLEAGLILHPSLPLDRLSAPVARFREITQATDARAMDTGKPSDTMRALCDAVLALAWRSAAGIGPPGEACHWADGYPLNVLLYVSLLQAIFDRRDETVVLDEVDELLELMTRTWTTLGIVKKVHNVCLAWVLFQQYVATGQVQPDLTGAALTMLTEVAADTKQECRDDPVYVRVLSSVLSAIHDWSEKRLLEYHEWYGKRVAGMGAEAMESAVSLALSTGKIIAEKLPGLGINSADIERNDSGAMERFAGARVDSYVRCSVRSAFTKMLENELGQGTSGIIDHDDEPSEILARLAKDTEQLALFERDYFSPMLKRWHPFPGAAAVATLHSCFGVVLKQYLAKATNLTNELVHVLHAASRLEKALLQMLVEDVADTDDGGKSVVSEEVVSYDVESIVARFLKAWIEERLGSAKECVTRAKDTESWIPKSKHDSYAQSAVALMKLAKAIVDEFFGIPVSARDDMVRDLADGLEAIFQEYVSFLASCGNTQSYLPALPHLTRCNQDSKIIRLWKRAATPCRAPMRPRGDVYRSQSFSTSGGHNPRPSTSRGTQRLYVRLNTLHYLLSHIQALDKSLSFFSSGRCTSPTNRRLAPSSYFDHARSATQSAIGRVAEVAAYRLIFLDSHHSFYEGLYAGGVTDARIRPALRTLKQNLSLLVSVLVDRAQPVAVREVMKASFQAFLTVLLAGGSDRSFTVEDHAMIEEDFRSLKRVFCTRGEGLVAEDVVEAEAQAAESVVALMALTAEQLVEEFGIASCESRGECSDGHRLPLPTTTRQWGRMDPDTIVRVLCHREDEVASHFLKRSFQLPKRR